jgi:hypothetical protein
MMSEHELEKLLGGFAADTLTAEERKILYAAALQDQQLFNALADEQALKELLSDPVVRRRLLQALNQASASGAGGSLSWLDWFRRPAGLAFAGGLAAAVFAVVLGTKIYQDSLKQATQSAATEDTAPTASPAPATPALEPAPPQAAEPKEKAKKNVAPTVDLLKKDTVADKMAKREHSAPSPLQEQRAFESTGERLKQRSGQDEVRKPADAPVATRGKPSQEARTAADQKLAASSAPPATPPASAPLQAQVNASEATSPGVSARRLFYGGEPARLDGRTKAQEKERAMKPLIGSAPQAIRSEQKSDEIAAAGKAAGAATQLKPLGLRYSFVVRGNDGQDREVDAMTASKSTEPVGLVVEANQDSYLQIWKTAGSSTPQLLFPEKESGQISAKLLAGQRQQISLSADSGPITLTTRLSRVPFGPITRQEAAMFDRLSHDQLQETITARGAAGSQEEATYVVSRDSTPAAQLSVAIPLGLH